MQQRFGQIRTTTLEMFTKLCKQSYNSKVWFKMFGALGAGLLGVTVLSQFFIGRMKVPKVQKENK